MDRSLPPLGETPPRTADLQPAVRDAVVAFLRGWLPREARRTYLEMMRTDPVGWSRDPHFSGGIIVDHALRGNGLDEGTLGVASLDPLWPDLLRLAVADADE